MEAAKAVMVAVLMAAVLFSSVSARNITVGGATGWDLSTNFTDWSSSTLVFVDDSLEFIYTRAHDVIEVTEANFATCDITSPIAAYYDINGKTTVINLPKPGPRYFVCGRSNHCTQGLKLYVQVLDRLQADASSPSYPSKPHGDHTSRGGGPNYGHKKHSPNSSSGEKNEDVPLWLRVALMIINLAVLVQLADDDLVRLLVRVYLYILFCYLMVLAAALLVRLFLGTG
ncbi:early nodulin-like protein 15 [Silene latifolia]|uniref:early nodulin-like protein 15 n=1 Tax=Silene latifolia TaxID=37657 RepID=UPI003D7899D1